MKRWLSLFAAGALALAVVSTGTAPSPAFAAKGNKLGKQGKGGGHLKKLREALDKLNLSADQKTQVDQLLNATQGEVKQIREGSGTPEEKKAKMKEAGRAMRQKLGTILTPEQKKQLRETMRANRKAKTAA